MPREVALSDAELVNAKKDGVWVDHMLPAIQETDDPAAAAAALKDPRDRHIFFRTTSNIY